MRLIVGAVIGGVLGALLGYSVWMLAGGILFGVIGTLIGGLYWRDAEEGHEGYMVIFLLLVPVVILWTCTR